eukprot:890785-Alexandrium_andersonii.AAC.1
MEDAKAFPGCLRKSLVSLVYKPGAEEAQALRPIVTQPMLYGSWASTRKGATQDWVRERQQDWAWGERRGREAAGAAWESALLGKHARAEGLSAGAIAFDCSKCYDR